MPLPQSIAGVVDVELLAGTQAPSTPNLIIEIPHGATRTADFTSLERELVSPLPSGLADFFHVNTDIGAPELGRALAQHLVTRRPRLSVLLLRCRVPRTFIDCNRRIDAAPEEFKAGKVTPGLMPWITADADRELLLSRYRSYVKCVDDAVAEVMPKDGAMLLLHSYAPREVGVEVNLDIVKSLHAAYAPDKEPTWPLRPEVDVIGKTVEGQSLAPQEVVAALEAGLRREGVPLSHGTTYPMHPSTLAHGHVTRWPGRVLCVEVRRDLLAEPWNPFTEMSISPAKVGRLAGAFADAVAAWW